jgi:very-short-patch-repair endonuclease
MDPKNIIPYNPRLKDIARQLRLNSTLSEIILWKYIKGKSFGYEFHRQVPINEFIVDFYCHELKLAIEIDGNSHDYNFDKDENRQTILENLGITIIRFDDKDIKCHLNDVLRALENIVSEIDKDCRIK